MKYLLFASMLFSVAWAEPIKLHCESGRQITACPEKVAAALGEVGCEAAQARCEWMQDGSTGAICMVESTNCQRPTIGNFGGDICYSGESVKLARRHGVHNGYWYGLFGSYSRTLCRTP